MEALGNEPDTNSMGATNFQIPLFKKNIIPVKINRVKYGAGYYEPCSLEVDFQKIIK